MEILWAGNSAPLAPNVRMKGPRCARLAPNARNPGRELAEAHPARLDRRGPGGADPLPALLRLPALPAPRLRAHPADDRARVRPGPAVGFPRPALSPPRTGQCAARHGLRASSAAPGALRAPTELRAQGTKTKQAQRSHLRLQTCLCAPAEGYPQDEQSELHVAGLWVCRPRGGPGAGRTPDPAARNARSGRGAVGHD